MCTVLPDNQLGSCSCSIPEFLFREVYMYEEPEESEKPKEEWVDLYDDDTNLDELLDERANNIRVKKSVVIEKAKEFGMVDIEELESH